jgi:hypothetical protein
MTAAKAVKAPAAVGVAVRAEVVIITMKAVVQVVVGIAAPSEWTEMTELAAEQNRVVQAAGLGISRKQRLLLVLW